MPHDLESIKRHFENAPFAVSCGMSLLELRPGFAKTVMTIEERRENTTTMKANDTKGCCHE
jgi:hypothetical protein